MTAQRRKAIALMSGGLDSTLAAKTVADQGIEVIGLHLVSPFGCRSTVQRNADAVGIALRFKDKGEAFLDLVKNPRYGYGANMNPCIDCRIFMFQLADVVRQDEGADFIVTGEVLGQRPMSQQKRSLELIDAEGPLGDRVLRPLSAHLLPESLAEREGWVDRSQLFRISGRGRKEQMAMAKAWGITEYENPAGGCLLTEGSFSGRLKDFFAHDGELSGETRLAQSALLRLGRHFRFHPQLKVIVGRNERENGEITALWSKSGGSLYEPEGFSGPVSLALGPVTEGERTTIGRIMARYGKGEAPYRILARSGSGDLHFEVSEPMEEAQVESLRIA